MTSVRIYRAAWNEFREAIRWYNARVPELGYDLIEEFESARDRIIHNPYCGERFRRSVFRGIKLHRFPYVVYYEATDTDLWIAAVAHAHRRPGYWLRRRRHE